MKGVNWSKTRKIVEAITVCLGTTIMVDRGYYGALRTIVTMMTAEKVPSRRRLCVLDSTIFKEPLGVN